MLAQNTGWQTHHVPQCHIPTVLEDLQGPPSGQPVPMPHQHAGLLRGFAEISLHGHLCKHAHFIGFECKLCRTVFFVGWDTVWNSKHVIKSYCSQLF